MPIEISRLKMLRGQERQATTPGLAVLCLRTTGRWLHEHRKSKWQQSEGQGRTCQRLPCGSGRRFSRVCCKCSFGTSAGKAESIRLFPLTWPPTDAVV